MALNAPLPSLSAVPSSKRCCRSSFSYIQQSEAGTRSGRQTSFLDTRPWAAMGKCNGHNHGTSGGSAMTDGNPWRLPWRTVNTRPLRDDDQPTKTTRNGGASLVVCLALSVQASSHEGEAGRNSSQATASLCLDISRS